MSDRTAILQELATCLETRVEAIVDRWLERTMADGGVKAVSNLTREEFKDNIVGVLAGLGEILRHGDPDARMPIDVADHGENRWRQSFSLQELVRDWGHLNSILIDEISAHFQDKAVDDPSRMEALRRFSRFSSDSLNISVAEYERLRQYEAASLFQDLERLRRQDQDMVEHRARALREYAHDMRGSLAALAGAGSVMSATKLSPEHLEQLANMIEIGVKSIAQMLETLLQLSRLEAGLESVNYERVRLREVADDLERLLAPLAQQKSLRLRISGDPELMVETDPPKLRRILQNLLVNAIKYTEEGSVSLIWERSENDRWRITVEDTGPGIQRDMGSYIAQQTANPEMQKDPAEVIRERDDGKAWAGEGIGLSIVKRLCEMLGILIEMESSPGMGTRFRLWGPLEYSSKIER